MSEILILDESYSESDDAPRFDSETGAILRKVLKSNGFLAADSLREMVIELGGVPYQVQTRKEECYLAVSPFFFPNSAANWSYSMYQDSLTCLERLANGLVDLGYSLIDGHCFNVVFYYCKPVFVDLGSIVEGVGGKGMAELDIYRKALISYRVTSARHTRRRLDSELEPPSYLDIAYDILSADPFVGWRSKMRRLVGLPGRSAWIDYYSSSPESYRDIPKENVVRTILEQEKPGTVYDIGCNTGHYALIAESCGANVVAADPDPDCVDYLYNLLKGSDRKILPLVADFDGFLRAIERPYWNLRPKSVDMVFMLALIHHLVYRANLSFENIFERVDKLGAESLLIEFVSKDDSNVASWDGKFPRSWYTLDGLCRVGGDYFTYCRVYDKHDTERKIVHFKGRKSL